MALFPTAGEGSSGAKSEVIYVKEELWVPVVRLGGKVWPLLSYHRTSQWERAEYPAVHLPRDTQSVPAARPGINTVSAAPASIG